MLATTSHANNALGSLVRFGLLALVPVVALGALLAHALNADVQQRYLETSKSSVTLITQVGVQPLLTAGELAGGLSPDAVAQIDDKLQGAAVSNEVRRIKVWNTAGTILYSDNHALIGRTFPIDDDLGASLRGTSSASITDGHDEENSGDNLVGPLIQVYVPLTFKGTPTPSGAFEVYVPYAPVQAAIDRESNQLYLLLAAGLALFYASMFAVVYIADRWRRRLITEAEATALANLAVLERLNALKSAFLTRISHQFRTALVGIEGFSEVIRDSEQLDLDEIRSFANDIHGDAERLDRSFSEMLELDRMEAGRAALKTAPAVLNALVAEVVEEVRPDASDHTIALTADPGVEFVPCDRDRVAQALKILIENALAYSPAGTEVGVTTRAAADAATITVSDHGRGMPADFDNGLFVGYQKNGGVGTGLGLAIARQIVDMHGGRIWFESVPGRGTDFHFSLPLRARRQPGPVPLAQG